MIRKSDSDGRLELKIGDKYKMIKKIGSGAFGEIYKGKYQCQVLASMDELHYKSLIEA